MDLNNKRDKRGRPSINLRDYYKIYSKEELESAISLLPKKDQLLLQKVYGKDLSSVDFSKISPQEKSRMYYIRKKLTILLNGSISKEKLIKRKNQSERAQSIKVYFSEYDWDMVEKAFEYLPQKSKELLIEAYGEGLDEINGYMQMSNNMKQRVTRARQKMKKIIKKIENNEPIEIKKDKKVHKEKKEKSLLEYLKEYSTEQIQQGIENLSPNCRLLLKKAYGDDFSSININQLSEEEKKRLLRIKKKLKYRIKTNYKPKRKDIRYHSLYVFFEAYSKEEIDKIVLSLDLDSLKLLRKTFGSTLAEENHYFELSNDEKEELKNIRDLMKRKLQESRQIPKKKNPTKISSNTKKVEKKRFSYRPLSRIQETRFLKKVKLSYYEDVEEDLQKKYLKYYFEVYPAKGEKYKNIIKEIKKIIKEIEEEKDYERCIGKKETLKQLRQKQQSLLKQYIEESKKHRDKFLMINEGLIHSKTKRFYNRDLADELTSEGQLGLMHALKKFDIEKGYKFSTYATGWISQSISRFFKSKEKIIRIPEYKETEISRMNDTIDRLTVELSRNPTIEEIAQEIGCTTEQIEELLENEYQFTNIANLGKRLFDDSGDDLESTLGVRDEQFQKVEDEIYFDEILAFLKKSYLTDLEIMVIKEIYGLGHTEKEISLQTGLSELRISLIEQSALNKIRSDIKVNSYLKRY